MRPLPPLPPPMPRMPLPPRIELRALINFSVIRQSVID